MLRRRTDRLASRFGVMPTPLREHAAADCTGRGVTIAFLDTGFAPHHDLTRSKSRILEYVDVTGEGVELVSDGLPFRWHGTMAAVVAAGNGFLSGGLYRSLAWEANVVLVKVGRDGVISPEDLARGLEWVLANRERHQIRVISLALEQAEDGYDPDPLDLAAEEAVRQGMVVVAPTSEDELVPPAGSPSVITVGGYLDHHQPDVEGIELYAHHYGLDGEGPVKPDVVSPAAYVAAPSLPGAPTERRSDAVFRLARAPERSLPKLVENLRSQAELPSWLVGLSVDEIRSVLVQLSEQEKFVNPHYQHVDGTSFGASIVTALVAQMLQANPGLNPAAIRQILVSTAERISRAPNLS
ncbi:MAG: S8 family serine peptidase, partial [Candidatus Eremiobacterota bacterium]